MRALYLLLGDPVAHSRSPAIHARAFALLGVDAVYAPCRVAAAELPVALAGLKSMGVSGFNVTVPHKEQVARMVERIDPSANRIGAVNCVTDEFAGYNWPYAQLVETFADWAPPDYPRLVMAYQQRRK